MKKKPTSKLPHHYIAIWRNYREELLNPPANVSDAEAEKIDSAADAAALAALDCRVTTPRQIVSKFEVIEFYEPAHVLYAHGLERLKLDLLSL